LFTSCAAKFRAIKSDDESSSGDAAKSRDGLARVHKTFNYSGQGEHQFVLTDGVISEEVTMTEALGESKAVFSQVERPLRLRLFKQGIEGQTKTDTFMQAPGAGVLDILIVMDNSASMAQEQANMASR